MSAFQPLQRKNHSPSTPATPTNSSRQPLSPLAPRPTSAPEHTHPVAQKELERSRRIGYSLARIPVFSPNRSDAPVQPIKRLHINMSGDREHIASSTDRLEERIRSARGRGRPLEEGVQRTLEQGLDADLSSVRVHDDSEAASLSRAVNAIAFTTGPDIFFRDAAYKPHLPQGLHLLAHEATHVVQQATESITGPPIGDGVTINTPNDRFEQAAEANANRITATASPPRFSTQESRIAMPPSSYQRSASIRPSAQQATEPFILQCKPVTFSNPNAFPPNAEYDVPDRIAGVPYDGSGYYYHFINNGQANVSLFQTIQEITGLQTFHITVDHTTGNNRTENGFHVKVVAPNTGYAYFFYDIKPGATNFKIGGQANLKNYSKLVNTAMNYVAAEFIRQTQYKGKACSGGPATTLQNVVAELPQEHQEKIKKSEMERRKQEEEREKAFGQKQEDFYQAIQQKGGSISLEDYLNLSKKSSNVGVMPSALNVAAQPPVFETHTTSTQSMESPESKQTTAIGPALPSVTYESKPKREEKKSKKEKKEKKSRYGKFEKERGEETPYTRH